jgi:hypothetical protein
MDFYGRPAKQRAAHYRSEAAKLRNMADGETVERIRVQLREVAAQYDSLAASLDVNVHDRLTG